MPVLNEAFKGFVSDELKELLSGYERYIQMLSAEVEKSKAYEEVSPYTDVLLIEREFAVETYANYKAELEARGIPVKSKITGIPAKWKDKK